MPRLNPQPPQLYRTVGPNQKDKHSSRDLVRRGGPPELPGVSKPAPYACVSGLSEEYFREASGIGYQTSTMLQLPRYSSCDEMRLNQEMPKVREEASFLAPSSRHAEQSYQSHGGLWRGRKGPCPAVLTISTTERRR